MVSEVVSFAVLGLNSIQKMAINYIVSLKVLFMGLKVHCKELLNSLLVIREKFMMILCIDLYPSKSRIIPCVALYPCANVARFGAFMIIISHKQVCRSQWVHMATTQLIIDAMIYSDRSPNRAHSLADPYIK